MSRSNNIERPGFIYRLVNSVDDNVYIGSTMRTIKMRLNDHKFNARHSKESSKLYVHMCKVGVDNCSIELVKDFKLITRTQLEQAEYIAISKQDKALLLNTDTEYKKRNKAAQANVRASRFKRGSLYGKICPDGHHKGIKTIVFSWNEYSNESRLRKSRSWAVSLYGLDEATRLAEEFRNTIYPLTSKVEPKSKK